MTAVTVSDALTVNCVIFGFSLMLLTRMNGTHCYTVIDINTVEMDWHYKQNDRLCCTVTASKNYICFDAVTDYLTGLLLSGHALFYYSIPTAYVPSVTLPR